MSKSWNSCDHDAAAVPSFYASIFDQLESDGVVRAAIALDIELLDLKSLRAACKGRRKAVPEDYDKSRDQTFGHGNLRFIFGGLSPC
jgi:hypothetical protein